MLAFLSKYAEVCIQLGKKFVFATVSARLVQTVVDETEAVLPAIFGSRVPASGIFVVGFVISELLWLKVIMAWEY